MDLEKLESFVMLAQVKNFTEAAENLYISQPALSKRIKNLEDELKVPLFNRIGKRTFLTSEGEYFLKYARSAIANHNLLLEHISQIRNLEKGILRFGATNFIGIYIMPQIIAEFTKQYPHIDIKMTINSSKNIIAMLENNELEFVFLSNYVLDENSGFISKKLTQDKLQFVVSKDHELAQQSLCDIDEIRKYKYITKGVKSSQTVFLNEILKARGIEFSNQLIINNQEAIKEAVCRSIGFSIISEKALTREIESGVLKTLAVKGVEFARNIHCVFIKDSFLTPAARRFLEIAEEIYGEGADM
ncbi:MAG: LysR family transcriptional regulator [Lachnospiraceae bacterium]|nr:LysR family transcriptional regulator [Lachnospiraceae bacterium]MDY5741473.1 LysR family transcriptional regulator [Lachnospiraceae bacterium]